MKVRAAVAHKAGEPLAIEMVDLEGPRAGEVLVSLRNVDTIAVVDLESEAVTWAITGMWRRQHYPKLLDMARSTERRARA